MAEQVRIQIMDYQYKDGEDNIADLTTATSAAASWTVNSPDWANFSALSSPAIQYLNNFVPTVTGVEYNLSFRITNYSGSGSVGFSTNGGVPVSARRTSNGTTTATFTANGDPLDIFGRNTNTLFVIDRISVVAVTEVDEEKSIMGELDVSSHADFPLALTFNINDVKNIDARKGAFSKTFKVPATKHNNGLLKNLYLPNSTYSGNPITTKKPCTILVGDLYSINGLLQITSSTNYIDNAPASYSCIFFGDNAIWTTLLEDALLKDVGLPNSTGLQIKKTEIMDSWAQVDATTTTSPIVYPLASYGEINETGMNFSVQLMRDDASRQSLSPPNSSGAYVGGYGTSASIVDNFRVNYNSLIQLDLSNLIPVVDWRPAIWVDTLFRKIFSNIGYTLESDFLENGSADSPNLFQFLLYSVNNFKYYDVGARWHAHTLMINFDAPTGCGGNYVINNRNYTWDNTYATTPNGRKSFGDWNLYVLNLGNFDDGGGQCIQIIEEGGGPFADTGYGFDETQGTFVVPEYGYYSLRVNHLQWICDNGYVNSTSTTRWVAIFLRLYFKRKPVGQSVFEDIYDEQGNAAMVGANGGQVIEIRGHQTSGNTSVPLVAYGDFDVLSYVGFLNKGDEVGICVQATARQAGSGGPATTVQFELGVSASDSLNNRAIFDAQFSPEHTEYGQTYDLEKVIPPTHTQIDFIKGISHAFNLQFQTNEREKSIRIEPFNQFYLDTSFAEDWTSKMDRSREVVDGWLKTPLKRESVWKYKTDGNDKNAWATSFNQVGVKDVFPFRQFLDNSFNIGKSEFENPFFSGTLCFPTRDIDGNATGCTSNNPPPYIAVSSTEEIDNIIFNNCLEPKRENKAYGWQPRLLYWNRFDMTMQRRFTIQDWGATSGAQYFSFYAVSDGGYTYTPAGTNSGAVRNDYIPQAVSYDQDLTSLSDSASIPNLCYGNMWDQDSNVRAGLYQTYWQGMIELLKINPRQRLAYFDLKIADIVNLDFRKLVYIDETYWRINKIIDYAPHLNVPTKVELVEWRELGDFQLGDPVVDSGGWYPTPSVNAV